MTDTPDVALRPLAVVTGASSGIGFELARQFAQNGFDVLVNSEDPGLEEAARELGATGAGVMLCQADLSTYEGVERLYAQIVGTGRPVEALALNAGIGAGGAFVDIDLDKHFELIDLNVRGTVHLAKRVLTDMVARNGGKVLFTSSIASTMPGSFQATYNASKSFIQSLAEALQNELKDTEVTVTSLMPGPTETNFFHRADMDDTMVGTSKKDDPAQVAEQGFKALMAGKNRAVGGGVKTKVQELGAKVMPDALKAQMHRGMAEPGTGKD
ncbi:SDR family NAD(P)-dependent oxidoreductase [Motilibacter deserti]|uniref:SDR family NAD(P)-dependent oxidoreductase n=1 Tax=Motilibacter deserti TaxID=2714956 RepID=A0ABX0GXG2_9ACTN|nr:SDR family NAD(P)-dependent oxidoreductase [Motilibacter deserti]NHC15672.1 SDR family NAD(P)-dependent oxidoreductase [Motilibacter deserti]